MMQFDSKEELYFSWYLKELYDALYIKSYIKCRTAYELSDPVKYSYEKQLKTKIKIIETTLLAGHVYTPDFNIAWTEKARGIFFNTFVDKVYFKKIPFIATGPVFPFSIIEIKPGFDAHNMQREFSINQKIMMQTYGLYVQKIIISNKTNSLFEKTFTPKKYLVTNKSGKPRKINYEIKTLQEFVDNGKNTSRSRIS